MATYTAFIVYPKYGDDIAEEIDVIADSPGEARELAQAELDRNYEPGGEIFAMEERFGLYL